MEDGGSYIPCDPVYPPEVGYLGSLAMLHPVGSSTELLACATCRPAVSGISGSTAGQQVKRDEAVYRILHTLWSCVGGPSGRWPEVGYLGSLAMLHPVESSTELLSCATWRPALPVYCSTAVQ